MSAAAFRSMTAFGDYLLSSYQEAPEERILLRRFDGGYDFPDGLAGFLWALTQCAAENPHTAERLLQGFERWNINAGDDSLRLWLQEHREPVAWDILEGGNAGRAAVLLPEKPDEAGHILSGMVERKKETGCFRIYPRGRKQFFLPSFLRGSTGIAFVLLRCAELSAGSYPYHA